MADSFFSARNYVDEQLDTQQPTAFHCEVLLEASIRQLIKRSNTRNAAEKLYRLADICAAEGAGPIEIKPPAVAIFKKPTRRIFRFFGSISWGYWIGLATGFYLGSTSR